MKIRFIVKVILVRIFCFNVIKCLRPEFDTRRLQLCTVILCVCVGSILIFEWLCQQIIISSFFIKYFKPNFHIFRVSSLICTSHLPIEGLEGLFYKQ